MFSFSRAEAWNMRRPAKAGRRIFEISGLIE
jgi:hypothetical protein